MRRRMLGLVLTGCALVACKKSESPATDTTTAAAMTPAPAPTPPPPPPALTLGDVAGSWDMRAVPDSGDTTATTYVLTATGDSTWKLTFSNGLVVQGHAMASGDSIVLHAGPYASVRRKGVQVMTDGVLRRDGDKLMGTTTAHYKTSKPDSVLHLHVSGTKKP